MQPRACTGAWKRERTRPRTIPLWEEGSAIVGAKVKGNEPKGKSKPQQNIWIPMCHLSTESISYIRAKGSASAARVWPATRSGELKADLVIGEVLLIGSYILIVVFVPNLFVCEWSASLASKAERIEKPTSSDLDAEVRPIKQQQRKSKRSGASDRERRV